MTSEPVNSAGGLSPVAAPPVGDEELRLHGSTGVRRAVLRDDEFGGWYECSCGWRSDAGTGLGLARARVVAAEKKLAAVEVRAGIAAAKHRPDETRGGCECGFIAWSVEHVAIMSVRDAMEALADEVTR